jgi:hypothetical protein
MPLSEKLERLTRLHNVGAIARAAEVHRDTLNYAIAGRRRPRRVVISALARVLNVDPDWLADDAQDWPPVWKHSEGRVAAVA